MLEDYCILDFLTAKTILKACLEREKSLGAHFIKKKIKRVFR